MKLDPRITPLDLALSEIARLHTAHIPCPVCRQLVSIPVDSHRDLVTCHPNGHRLATRRDIDGITLRELD